MVEDILTVMWKEYKGLLRSSGSRWKSIAILVTPIALFGVIFPIQFQEDWLAGYWSLAVAVVTPAAGGSQLPSWLPRLHSLA